MKRRKSKAEGNDSIECGEKEMSRNLKVTVRAIDKKERETSVSSLLVVDPVFSTPRLRRRRVNVRSRGKKGEKRFPKRKKPKEGGRGGRIKREREGRRERRRKGERTRTDQPKTWQHRPGRVATGICCDRGYDRYIYSPTRVLSPPSTPPTHRPPFAPLSLLDGTHKYFETPHPPFYPL